MSANEAGLEKMVSHGVSPARDMPLAVEHRRIRLIMCLSLALIVTVQLCLSPSGLLLDPDNWWQVKVGLDILASKAVPVTDIYSYTFAGQPWIAKEWLGQVLLAAGYQAFGWSGVAFVTISSIALMIFILAWHLSAAFKPMVTIAAVLVITFFAGAVYNARPLIFSLPLIVLWTAVLFRAAREEQPPPFWLLGLIVLWANLHGTFTFGFVIAAFAGLDCLSRVKLSQPKLLAKWVAFGLLCPLVTLINPYGLQAILATFTVASGNEAVPLISEWNPFNARVDLFAEGALLTAIAAMLVSGFRIRWTYAAFFIFTLHLFLAYSRFQYLWLLLMPIVLAGEIARQFPFLSARQWTEEARDALEQAIVKHAGWLSGALVACWFATAAIFVQFSAVAPSNAMSASGALAYARTNNLSGNVLNSYNFGGTLIFHGIKTYVDGRTDQLFLGGFSKATAEMGTPAGKAILQKEIEDRDIKWALLTVDDSRIPFFNELPDWRIAYEDEFSVIYVNGN